MAEVCSPIAGTQAEYAKHRRSLGLRGATEAAVSQAMKAKRIAAAIRTDGLIDFAAADRLWSVGKAPQIEFPTAAFAPAPEAGSDGDAYLAAKARRETAEADLAELKAAKAQGALISVDEARKTYHAIGRMFAQARENVPMQLAPKLVGKTDLAEIEALIRSIYREADTRVANEIQSRFAEVADGDHDPGSSAD